MSKFHMSLLRCLLVIIFFLSCFSGLFAQFAGGSGTAVDPYLVQTAAHLNNVRLYPGAHYKQIAEIDLNIAPYNQNSGWVPIGNSLNAFLGTYHGGNHTISNLYINSYGSEIGLFGETTSASMDSIILVGVNVTGSMQVGGLIGFSSHTHINKCIVSGTVTGSMQVGGLIGHSFYSNISNCFSGADITCSDPIFGAGGLIGSDMNSVISKCYSIGDVTGNEYAGGFIGSSEVSVISNCFSLGDINCINYSGGLLGSASQANITNCYSTGSVPVAAHNGGLIGSNSGSSIVSSYWNTLTSWQTISAGGFGRNTIEMTYPYAANTYVNWDFNNIWVADADLAENNGYPYLQDIGMVKIVKAPTFSQAGGLYTTPLQVTLQTETIDAQIYYTLNGEIPDEQSLLYSEPLNIDETTTVKARAYRSNWISSNISTANYVFKVETPIINPSAGHYSEPIQVTIHTTTVGANIYYSLDGSVPTMQSTVYDNPIVIDTTTVLKAIAFKNNWNPSEIVVSEFDFGVGNEDCIYPGEIINIFAYPNPFNPNTTISFDLPKAGKVSLTIYNQKGQLVRTLADNYYSKGTNSLQWNGKSDAGEPVPSGIYIYKLQGVDFHITRKMTLMK